MALPHVFHLPPGTREPRGHALLLRRVNAQAIYRAPLKLGLRAGTGTNIQVKSHEQFQRQETEKYIHYSAFMAKVCM